MSVIVASLMGIALAFPASAQQSDAQKRYAAFAACHREADTAVPAQRTEQEEMNHYIAFSAALRSAAMPWESMPEAFKRPGRQTKIRDCRD
jgi:hypothetical protein